MRRVALVPRSFGAAYAEVGLQVPALGPRGAPILVLAGPTAVGKSELAVALCAAIHGEVLSVDSAAVYRGLEIGTAKPGRSERAAVPHHLLDLRDPREPFTAAEYRQAARAALAEVWGRGRVPVLVGGSGLYLRVALADAGVPAVPPDPQLRQELAARPPGQLYAELMRVDPRAAAGIHPANTRRVIRALEVFLRSGRPISEYWDTARPRLPACLLVIDRPQPVLRARIAARVAAMLERGLVAEVRGLLAAGVPPQSQSLAALGYRQVVRCLQGETPAADLEASIVQATVRFARRQRTWFRAEPDAQWLDAAQAPASALLPQVRSRFADWLGGYQAPR